MSKYHPPTTFPGGSDGKDSICNARTGMVQSLGREDPLEKEMATHSSILYGESHGQRATHSSTLAWKIPWMEEPVRL